MSLFAEIEAESKSIWNDIEGGEKPFIRIGTAMCGVAVGANAVVDEVKNFVNNNDIDATVSEVGCIGICFAEPILDIKIPDGTRLLYGNVSPENISNIIDGCLVKSNFPKSNLIGTLGETTEDNDTIPNLLQDPIFKLQHKIVLRNAGEIDPCDINQYIGRGGYSGLNKALTKMKSEEVLQEVMDSGLRGRGGAFFATGLKWSFLSKANTKEKYILCNCEEGDPGAFNDKGILESDPHTLIEGIILAGYATNSSDGIVFVRHGHAGPINKIKTAISQAYEKGLLGENILGSGFSFDIDVSLTGESYVAGEETALMDAIEGKRSMPRSKPPFPAAFGVWGKPTNINNVKTLAYIPSIIQNGGEWFKNIGVNKSTGTAIICLSGKINNPGLYEVPLGISIGEVINQIGGGVKGGNKIKLLQTGGPLGGVLGEAGLDINIDFDEMAKAGAILGSGGIIVADETTCAVDLTRVLVAFCQYESCGKCFPCRLGMSQMLETINNIAEYKAGEQDLEKCRKIGGAMQAGSLCGHGQLGFNPIRSALQYFKSDFDTHVFEKKCPTGGCESEYHFPISTKPYGSSGLPESKPVNLIFNGKMNQ